MLRPRGDRQLEQHHQRAVARLQEAVGLRRVPEILHVERERRGVLHVHRCGQEHRAEEEEESGVTRHDPAGALEMPLVVLRGPGAVRQGRERDRTEGRGGDGVADEQQVVGPGGQHAAEGEPDREPQVQHQPVGAEGGDPAFGRDQIDDEGARGRTVELGDEPQQDDDADDGPQTGDPDERERQQRTAEHRDGDRVAASQPVGEQATDALGADRAEAVAREAQPRLRHGVAAIGQVQRDERQDERAEPVDERADEQDPRLTRHASEVLTEGGSGGLAHASEAPGRFQPVM